MRNTNNSIAAGRATLTILILGLFLNSATRFAVLYISLYLSADREFSAELVGVILAANGAGGLLGTVNGGIFADRWTRRGTLLLGHGLSVVGIASLTVLNSPALVAVALVIFGFGNAMCAPAFITAIVDITPADRLSKVLNLQYWATSVGTVLAAVLGGVLTSIGYIWVFGLDAATTLLTFLLILIFTTDATGPPIEPDEQFARSVVHDLRRVFADIGFILFVVLLSLQLLLVGQTTSILPIYLSKDLGHPGWYPVVTTFSGVMIAACQLLIPYLTARLSDRQTLAVACTLIGIGICILSVANTLVVLLASTIVWTLGVMMAAPPNAAIVARTAPPDILGQYQAVFYLAFPVSATLGPAVGGWGIEHLGPSYWLAVGAIGPAIAIGHLLLGRMARVTS